MVAIGARIHRVRGYLIPRQKGVAFKEEYYPWDETAMGHQAQSNGVQKGRDSLVRLEKWTARLIDEHGVEWDDDAIRTRALYLATEELRRKPAREPPRWTRRGKPCC